MSITLLVEWVILGLISGFIASKIINKTGGGILYDILVGVAVLS
jgi:uncharacterized membrane protein YeaQ/YmgE (transglycosylase-associated protein family)